MKPVNMLGLVIILVGLVLIYAAVKNVSPLDVAKGALTGKGLITGAAGAKPTNPAKPAAATTPTTPVQPNGPGGVNTNPNPVQSA